MLTFIWNVLTIPAAVVTLIVSVFFLVVGLWNSGLLLWNRIDTAAERDEMKNYFVEIGAAIAGILTALRALAMTALLILAVLALDMPAGGTGTAKAATIIHCDDRTGCRSIEAPRPALNPRSKIARNIQKRPNVEISRPVKVRADAGTRKGTVIVLRGMGGYLPLGGMDALGAKIRAKGYRVIVSAPDFWSSYRNERPTMIVGCSLGGTNALELARVVKNSPRVITIDPTRSNSGWRTRPNRGAPNGVAVINLYNPTNVLGGGYVKGAANYQNNIGHMAMCSAAPIHAIVLAHL